MRTWNLLALTGPPSLGHLLLPVALEPRSPAHLTNLVRRSFPGVVPTLPHTPIGNKSEQANKTKSSPSVPGVPGHS